MVAVYKREMRSFFSSMTGYIFVAVVVAYIGLYFLIYNMMIGYPAYSLALGSACSIFIFITPLITMRSMAEERHSKTDQLLLTSPASVTGIVLGKYFAALTVFAVPLIICCFCPIIISMYGSGYMAGDYIMILAVLFFGMLLTAIGVFISSQTESQIIAAVLSLIVNIVLYMWTTVVLFLPTEALGSCIGFAVIWIILCAGFYGLSRKGRVSFIAGAAGTAALAVLYIFKSGIFENSLTSFLSVLSITAPIYNLADYGVLDFGSLFFYVSVSALMLFLTVQTVRRRRWS